MTPLHLNFVQGSREGWYCFALVPKKMIPEFELWMSSNLPACQVIKFGAESGQYEIRGNDDAERMLFTMRWD